MRRSIAKWNRRSCRTSKRSGFIVFAYSLLLTGSMNFLAVMLIPDKERLTTYYDNWMGGLAMHMLGPVWLLLDAERVCRVRRVFDSCPAR